MPMKTIRTLLRNHKGSRIYIYLHDSEAAGSFLRNAENEGFTFPDGAKPTMREAAVIFAVNEDMTINYVGFAGHTAFQCGAAIGDKPLVRIDCRTMTEFKKGTV